MTTRPQARSFHPAKASAKRFNVGTTGLGRGLGLIAGALLIVMNGATAAHAQREPAAPVRLEVVMVRGVDPAVAHDFAETFAEAGVELRIRAMRVNDEVEIKNVGSDERPSYLVIGFLTPQRRLILPGGEFGIRDAARVKTLLGDVASQGPDALVAERLVFGLTPAQLLEINDQLAAPVTISTDGEPIRSLVRRIAESLPASMSIEAAAADSLEDNLLCEDELEGLSTGTALASLLRPAGLLLTVVKDERGRVGLRVVDSRSTDEFWPIGWPYDRNPAAIAPVLADRIKVNITDFRLDQALSAIESKIEMPMLIDRNSLAEAGIELDEVVVSYSHDSAPYSAILTKLLTQAEPPLRYEVRVDENEKPFLWISVRAR
ncbi:MAG: hypothetical protein KDA83_10625 [Planctomycetales bacterium]|nr:hypothetical protein [Planctomycetales bacterium]